MTTFFQWFHRSPKGRQTKGKSQPEDGFCFQQVAFADSKSYHLNFGFQEFHKKSSVALLAGATCPWKGRLGKPWESGLYSRNGVYNLLFPDPTGFSLRCFRGPSTISSAPAFSTSSAPDLNDCHFSTVLIRLPYGFYLFPASFSWFHCATGHHHISQVVFGKWRFRFQHGKGHGFSFGFGNGFPRRKETELSHFLFIFVIFGP